MGYAPRGTWQHFYPRPPRGGRLMIATTRCKGGRISIHALREEGDGSPSSRWITVFRFLSTPSARRATGAGAEPLQCCRYFYPRPPRGGRRRAFLQGRLPVYFYPRPPRGGRLHPGISPCCTPKFLSTPSARRATHHPAQTQSAPHISIHALREEGDSGLRRCPVRHPDFYPRPPRGGRQQKQRQNLYFQTNYTTFCTNLEEP